MATTDTGDRQRLRARETFAFGSALQLAFSTFVEGEDLQQMRLEVLTNRIILPYVCYGTVLLSDLETIETGLDEVSGRSLLHDLLYAKQKGLCGDVRDIFPEDELDEANKRFYSETDPFVIQFNAAFNQVDFENCASIAETFTRQKYIGGNPEEHAKVWHQEMQRVSSMIGLGPHDGAELPPEIRELSDDALTHKSARMSKKCMLFHLESQRLKLVALGKQPTVTHLNSDMSSESKLNKVKLLEISFPKIALPRLQTTKDLIDFVMMDEYRIPMKRLRSHCTELASGSQSIAEISEAISDDLYELDRCIKQEKLARYFGMCKFIFGTAFGFAEDILKVRLENMAKRPFEIAEKISEQYYYGPQYKKEPLYFLWAVKDRFGE